jgi:GTP-binding protein EngB required for normal cell division
MSELLDEIGLAVRRIYREAVDPVAGKFAFGGRPTEGEIGGAPAALFLGNHSSGKSTFINHLLGLEIQKTGLAPTDDGFTVIAWGASDEERDGPAVASNPDLPYEPLRQFGPELLSHLRMKRRPVPLLREVSLVDSPGMIDAAKEGSGRGYDFTGAVRWFAERADVVLVFFDPDKPGTTGETLQVFTQSLRGIDHKLLIVMNKMDRFQSLPDFARAYGALCWNLGKVIPRKDLPHIFTTFVPVPEASAPALPMKDFEAAREELVREIRRAPARRADNLLTQAEDHSRKLLLHARVIDAAARSLRAFRWKLWGLLALMTASGALAGVLSGFAGARGWVTAIIYAAAALMAVGGFYGIRGLVSAEARRIADGLPSVFEELYARELLVRERTEDLWTLWEKVHPHARQVLKTMGLLSFPRLRPADAERLRKAVEVEIPELRSRLHRELPPPRRRSADGVE